MNAKSVERLKAHAGLDALRERSMHQARGEKRSRRVSSVSW